MKSHACEGAAPGAQIGREGRLPRHRVPGRGGGELQAGGVQGLAAEGAQRPGELGAAPCREAQPAAVDRVAHEGVVQVGQVHADLVGPPGLETDPHVGVGPEGGVHGLEAGPCVGRVDGRQDRYEGHTASSTWRIRTV